jgi:hypothetical protein
VRANGLKNVIVQRAKKELHEPLKVVVVLEVLEVLEVLKVLQVLQVLDLVTEFITYLSHYQEPSKNGD